MRLAGWLSALAIFAFADAGSGVRAQSRDFSAVQIKTTKLADNLYVLVGAPNLGNIVALVGPDGIFLIDSMYPQMHDKIMAALRQISPQPIRYVVNTHLHGDHTAGNALMVKEGALVISQENMRKRMLEEPRAYPPDTLPTLTYKTSITFNMNGEEIYVYHPEPAHTNGDSIIYFKKANVMHVGDVPASLRYPNIGVNEGGSVDGMIDAGREVMRLANADTKIVPGHLGPVVGFKEIQQQLVMFQAVRARVAAAIRDGKTEAEVVASKPTKDFDEGRLAGAITPDRFVSLVYTDLSRRIKGAN